MARPKLPLTAEERRLRTNERTRQRYAANIEEERARGREKSRLPNVRERQRKWRVGNRERVAGYAARWRANNPEKAKEVRRKSAAKWRAANPEQAKEQSRKWIEANREHVNASARARAAADPDIKHKRLQTQLRIKYGITVKEYEAMVVAQGGRCAICETSNFRGKGARLHVDHDPSTGVVRSLLCCHCNPGLGFFKHDIDILQRAIDYLKKF